MKLVTSVIWLNLKIRYFKHSSSLKLGTKYLIPRSSTSSKSSKWISSIWRDFWYLKPSQNTLNPFSVIVDESQILTYKRLKQFLFIINNWLNASNPISDIPPHLGRCKLICFKLSPILLKPSLNRIIPSSSHSSNLTSRPFSRQSSLKVWLNSSSPSLLRFTNLWFMNKYSFSRHNSLTQKTPNKHFVINEIPSNLHITLPILHIHYSLD